MKQLLSYSKSSQHNMKIYQNSDNTREALHSYTGSNYHLYYFLNHDRKRKYGDLQLTLQLRIY